MFNGGCAEPAHGSVLLNGERIECVGHGETLAGPVIVDCMSPRSGWLKPGFQAGIAFLTTEPSRAQLLREPAVPPNGIAYVFSARPNDT
jgi:hypothetical protein